MGIYENNPVFTVFIHKSYWEHRGLWAPRNHLWNIIDACTGGSWHITVRYSWVHTSQDVAMVEGLEMSTYMFTTLLINVSNTIRTNYISKLEGDIFITNQNDGSLLIYPRENHRNRNEKDVLSVVVCYNDYLKSLVQMWKTIFGPHITFLWDQTFSGTYGDPISFCYRLIKQKRLITSVDELRQVLTLCLPDCLITSILSFMEAESELVDVPINLPATDLRLTFTL